jgi:hypothetical protein
MNAELEKWNQTLQLATLPEDVFGLLTGTLAGKMDTLQAAFRRIAAELHPDRYPDPEDRKIATEAFIRLQKIYEQALERVGAGAYRNDSSTPDPDCILIQSPSRTYSVYANYRLAPPVTVYPAETISAGRIAKVEIHLGDEEPVTIARSAYMRLRNQEEYDRFQPYFQKLDETFRLRMAGREYYAVVYERLTGWHSLADVVVQHPDGIDPRDMAWIFRRLLSALGFIHRAGLIHRAILPENILIEPDQHGLMLTNFYSTGFPAEGMLPIGLCLPPGRSHWMPPGLKESATLLPGFDLYLAAQCMRFICGGEVTSREPIPRLPAGIQSFLRGCTLPNPTACPQDAWELLNEFDQLIERLWGTRKFRPFKMAQTA